MHCARNYTFKDSPPLFPSLVPSLSPAAPPRVPSYPTSPIPHPDEAVANGEPPTSQTPPVTRGCRDARTGPSSIGSGACGFPTRSHVVAAGAAGGRGDPHLTERGVLRARVASLCGAEAVICLVRWIEGITRRRAAGGVLYGAMSSCGNLLMAEGALLARRGTIVDLFFLPFFSQAGRSHGLTTGFSDPGRATCDDPLPLKTSSLPWRPT